jgi:hypothetical protein
MAWNGSGTFTRTLGSAAWVGDAAAGTKIVANRHDTNDTDLATGINAALAKNGENAFTGTTGGSALRGAVDNTSDLGSTSLRWRSLYAGTSVVFQGASFATTVTAAPSANRAVVVPDKAGTLALTEQYLLTNSSTNSGATTVSLIASGLSTDAWSEITVFFDNVGISGTDNVLIQLIDAVGTVTTGYLGLAVSFTAAASQTTGSTSGFILPTSANAAAAFYGSITLRRQRSVAMPGGDTWTINGALHNNVGSNGSILVSGNVALNSDTPTLKLDGLRLITTGANTFNSGSAWVTGRI